MSANARAKSLGVPANRIGAWTIRGAAAMHVAPIKTKREDRRALTRARHHRRYGAEPRPLLRHGAGVLALPKVEP